MFLTRIFSSFFFMFEPDSGSIVLVPSFPPAGPGAAGASFGRADRGLDGLGQEQELHAAAL